MYRTLLMIALLCCAGNIISMKLIMHLRPVCPRTCKRPGCTYVTVILRAAQNHGITVGTYGY